MKSQGFYDIFSFGDFSQSPQQEAPFLIVLQEVTQFSPSFCWSFLGAEPPRGRCGTFVRVASSDGASVMNEGIPLRFFQGINVDYASVGISHWGIEYDRMDITDLNHEPSRIGLLDPTLHLVTLPMMVRFLLKVRANLC